jgi:DNA polymerase-3 subunit epsilon
VVTWAAVDVETTGLHPVRNRIVEISVIQLDADANPTDEWSTLVNPGPVPPLTRIHGITTAELQGAPTFAGLVPELLWRLSGRVIVAHNAPFDVAFLQAETVRAGIAWGPVEGFCTMEVINELGISRSRKLHVCCDELGVPIGAAHSALADARGVAGLLGYLGPRLWSIETPGAAPVWPPPAESVPTYPRPTAIARADSAVHDLTRRVVIPAGLDITEPAASTYVALLDRVLEDRRVTAEEVDALSLFAHACGISRQTARQLHVAYLGETLRIARADGIVTAEEQADMDSVTVLLTAALPHE